MGAHTLDQEDPKQKKPKSSGDQNGDGKLTSAEAILHWQNGNGTLITVNADTIDLNFLNPEGWGWKAGEAYVVQTFGNSHGTDGLVYGQITVDYLGNNKVSIRPDGYNFEHHYDSPWYSVRNVQTAIARTSVVGKGNEFKINFKGINVITPRRNSSNEGYRPRKK